MINDLLDNFFDQYSRYRLCADIVTNFGYTENDSILDIGSGTGCLLGKFLEDMDVTYLDPLFSTQEKNRYNSDIFAMDFDTRQFSYVTAVDVLEHITPEKRQAFLEKTSSIAQKYIILAFPSLENPTAAKTDELINSHYKEIYNRDYPWLKEHIEYGLPSVRKTCEYLNESGWSCQTMKQGNAKWLQNFLTLTICSLDMPGLSEPIIKASRKLNKELARFDFSSLYYRDYIIASKPEIATFIQPVQDSQESHDQKFIHILSEGLNDNFSTSLKLLRSKDDIVRDLNVMNQEKEATIQNLNVMNQEKEATIQDLNTGIQERDSTIQDLNERIQTVITKDRLKGEEIKKISKALEAKQAELMEMSDWADGLRKELEKRDRELIFRIKKRMRYLLLLLRKILSKTVVGDIYRGIRDFRRQNKNRISIDEVKTSLKQTNGQLLITFPVIAWDFRWQRPQQIVSRFGNQGFTILYALLSIVPLNRPFKSIHEAKGLININRLKKHIYQMWLYSSNRINLDQDLIEGENLYNLSLCFQALLKELNPDSLCYFVQFPGWWPLIRDLKKRFGGKVVFDCLDEYSGFSTTDHVVLRLENDLIKSADLIIASSAVLEEKCLNLNVKTIQVKNGTEYEHFANSQKTGVLEHLSNRPIIGYYGAISEWFDIEIIEYCSMHRPEWNFVLIGSTFGADLSFAKTLKNVYFLGEKPYQELPIYLAYFDVCTIPFKVIPLTLATNPVKFYEYMSTGKPVVSVNLPELIPYQDLCYLAKNKSEFLDCLDRALTETHEKSEKVIKARHQLAKENSWDARAQMMVNAIENLNRKN